MFTSTDAVLLQKITGAIHSRTEPAKSFLHPPGHAGVPSRNHLDIQVILIPQTLFSRATCYLSIYLSVYLSVCLSIYPSIPMPG